MVYEIKQEYVKKINAQLEEIEGKISEIQESFEENDSWLKSNRLRTKLIILDINLVDANSKLKTLVDSSNHSWRELRFDLENIMWDLAEAVDDTLRSINKAKDSSSANNIKPGH